VEAIIEIKEQKEQLQPQPKAKSKPKPASAPEPEPEPDSKEESEEEYETPPRQFKVKMPSPPLKQINDERNQQEQNQATANYIQKTIGKCYVIRLP
jgi:hypothetical protein